MPISGYDHEHDLDAIAIVDHPELRDALMRWIGRRGSVTYRDKSWMEKEQIFKDYSLPEILRVYLRRKAVIDYANKIYDIYYRHPVFPNEPFDYRSYYYRERLDKYRIELEREALTWP
jgi:restriction endonuclease S subunit